MNFEWVTPWFGQPSVGDTAHRLSPKQSITLKHGRHAALIGLPAMQAQAAVHHLSDMPIQPTQNSREPKVALRVRDDDVMHLLRLILKASGKQGVPQGGVISPLLSNIYLTEVDRMLERAKTVTTHGEYCAVEYARFADDLVVLVDAHPRHAWLKKAVPTRLRQELAKLQVEVNEEKSTTVELGRGESFGFLGFEFRRIRARSGAWRAQYTPKLKKRTALLQRLKDVFRRFQSQPVGRVIELINPILRGWVNYFAIGHSSRCFSYIQDWVEKKIRRHIRRAQKRHGFGWTTWSRQRLGATLGLFNGYRVRSRAPKASPA